MIITPVHVPEDDCYRVYLVSKGLRQQVGTDFTYTGNTQDKAWIDCLSYAKELEDQLKYYKDND
jgi:hypothetical protein